MATKDQDAWISQQLGPAVLVRPANAAPGGVAAGPKPPAAGPPAAAKPAADDINFVPAADVKQLAADTDTAGPLVEAALAAGRSLAATAAANHLALGNPQAAADLLRANAPKLSDQDRALLQHSLDQLDAQRVVMQNIFHQMEGAQEAFKAEIDARARQSIKVDVHEAGTADDLDDAGDTAEHTWDATVAIVSQDVLQGSFDVFLHALYGTDLVKDFIKSAAGDDVDKIKEKIVALDQQLQQQAAAFNDLIDALNANAAQKAANAGLALTRFLDDYRQALQAYAQETETYAKLLGKAAAKARAAGSGKPGPAAAQVLKTFEAVHATYAAFQRARSALITHTLAEGKYKAWVDLLVPLGTVAVEVDDQPTDLIVGSWTLYRKGGGQNAFRETGKTMQGLSDAVAKVQQFYGAVGTVEKIYAAWNGALQGIIGL